MKSDAVVQHQSSQRSSSFIVHLSFSLAFFYPYLRKKLLPSSEPAPIIRAAAITKQ